MEIISKGDLSERRVITSNDEIADLCQNVNKLLTNTVSAIQRVIDPSTTWKPFPPCAVSLIRLT